MLPRSISQFIAIVILFLIVQGTIILTLALTAFPIRDDFAGMSKLDVIVACLQHALNSIYSILLPANTPVLLICVWNILLSACCWILAIAVHKIYSVEEDIREAEETDIEMHHIGGVSALFEVDEEGLSSDSNLRYSTPFEEGVSSVYYSVRSCSSDQYFIDELSSTRFLQFDESESVHSIRSCPSDMEFFNDQYRLRQFDDRHNSF
ncbi:hypothetical protein PRIPAC_95213 [Pristionchus pacificus]|uniref:Uncharacterized protein n=1 Tax=Pristionchus pacificus TaxID=54126 RepID=A0A2A6B2Q1_PRIPA|nr:hypothetical protein PRIPAC_95213 [Pristionchus pacificus]|eukprot:PDM60156.1 hypothetical protein PRIPAC_53981 [Pristionchus pacificus]